MLMVAVEKDQIKLKTKVIERKNIHTLLAMHDRCMIIYCHRHTL